MNPSPSPWKVGKAIPVEHGIRILDRNGHLAAVARGSGGPWSVVKANARLIAKAPAMFAAIRDAIIDLDDWAKSETEREYDVSPDGLKALANELRKAIR